MIDLAHEGDLGSVNITKLLLAAALLTNIPVLADEVTFDTLSIHTNSTYSTWVNAKNPDGSQKYYFDANGQKQPLTVNQRVRYNDLNYGIGYKFEGNHWWSSDILVGVYHNSYYKPTFYVAKEIMPFEHFGVVVGAATGYEYATGHPVSILGGFIANYRLTEKVGVTVLALPPIGGHTGIFHLQFGYKL